MITSLLTCPIGLGVRVFANGPGDLGSIPGRVIPKTQKMVLDTSLLNTQHYKVRIKGKVEQSREGVAPSPTPWCSSYPRLWSPTLLFTFILADLNAVVWRVSIRSLISESSSPFSKDLGIFFECTNYNWYHRHAHVP